jgi:hypothetical protein
VLARIGGNQATGQVEVAIKRSNARLIVWLSAWHFAGAFGEDHHLAVMHKPVLGVTDHFAKGLGLGAAINPDHGRLHGVPAKQRDKGQLAFHDKTDIGQDYKRHNRIEHAHMLASNQGRPGRDILLSAYLDPHAGNPAQAKQHDMGPDPEPPGHKLARQKH